MVAPSPVACCTGERGHRALIKRRAAQLGEDHLVSVGLQRGVHENTVRYRLRKLAEVTKLGLHDVTNRLAMMTELAPPTQTKRLALSKHDNARRCHCLARASPSGGIRTTMEIAEANVEAWTWVMLPGQLSVSSFASPPFI